MLTGRIHSLETFGAVDGPGIRFVVFFQGCPLRCRYCHNPDSWAPAAGTKMTADEIVSKVLDYRPFYRGGGVTLSGGEPLMQHEFAMELITKLKAHGLHTAIDTAGSIPLSVCKSAVDACDMLLLDFKAPVPEPGIGITGMTGIFTREQQYLEYCERIRKPVWVRYVAVPGLTMDGEKLRALARYLSRFSCVKKVEPLPFHKLGQHKWAEGTNTLADTPAPTEEDMRRVKKIFRDSGLTV